MNSLHTNNKNDIISKEQHIHAHAPTHHGELKEEYFYTKSV